MGSRRSYKRVGPPGRFQYVDSQTGRAVRDAGTLERIKGMRIPPAYKEVLICADPRSKVQAFGYDAKHRKQTMYSKAFRESQRAKRFADLAGFEKTFAAIRRSAAARLASPATPERDRLVAAIVLLTVQCHFRIGSRENVEKYGTYGLTTLLSKHVQLHAKSVDITFVGKKSVLNRSSCTDPGVVQLLRRLKARAPSASSPIFAYRDETTGARKTISAEQVNTYLKSFDPNITCKDLRTYCANVLFVKYFKQEAQRAKPASDTAWKRAVREAIKRVAHDLHNTVAVARADYLHRGLVEQSEGSPAFRRQLFGVR